MFPWSSCSSNAQRQRFDSSLTGIYYSTSLAGSVWMTRSSSLLNLQINFQDTFSARSSAEFLLRSFSSSARVMLDISVESVADYTTASDDCSDYGYPSSAWVGMRGIKQVLIVNISSARFFPKRGPGGFCQLSAIACWQNSDDGTVKGFRIGTAGPCNSV